MNRIYTGILLFLSVCAARSAETPGERWLREAQRPKNSDKVKAAYEQLAKIHACEFRQWDHRGSFMILSFDKASRAPMDVLYRMGLDVLPLLAEALDDDTPSKTTTRERRGPEKVWRVNELVARLIVRIADRDFDIGKEPNEFGIREIGSRPRSAVDFKKAVVDWYEKNRKKTVAARKIDDVKDAWFRNRFDAIEWLGKNKVAAGRAAISDRIAAILRGRANNTLIFSELSLCSLALGEIGNADGLPDVQRVCRFLVERQERWTSGSGGLDTLFEAYHGLALLGKKADALRTLKTVVNDHWEKLDATRRKEFEERLAAASKW